MPEGKFLQRPSSLIQYREPSFLSGTVSLVRVTPTLITGKFNIPVTSVVQPYPLGPSCLPQGRPKAIGRAPGAPAQRGRPAAHSPHTPTPSSRQASRSSQAAPLPPPAAPSPSTFASRGAGRNGTGSVRLPREVGAHVRAVTATARSRPVPWAGAG